MQQTKDIMGMHVTVEIEGADAEQGMDLVYKYFQEIDQTFSTYKPDSEISKINRGELAPKDYSEPMKEIFKLAAETKKASHGYFDIQKRDGSIDPSGIVKGWAIWQAGKLLSSQGFSYWFIDAGGDVQTSTPQNASVWRVGIRNPFKNEEVVKVLGLRNEGVATSGTYERGAHIYDPFHPDQKIDDIVSLSVVGPNIYEADRFATAAFAMGRSGIEFIEAMPGLEGYMIGKEGLATMTSNFERYVIS